jgi:enterochelin esterase-like enzyme
MAFGVEIMAKLLPLIAAIFLLSALKPVRGQGAGSIVLRADFQSITLGRTYQYGIYLPAGYEDSGTRYPVIYLLHGRGDAMDAWLNASDLLDQMIADGSIPPIIAVMPDMPSSERASYYIDSQYTGTLYRAEAVETAFMNDLIPHIETTYRTYTNREARLVGGYSMGGYGALRYSMAYPERFVGALVLSPAVYIPLPPAESSTREFGAFGNGDALFDEATYQQLNYPALVDSLAASELPLSLFIAVGDDEWKNPNPEDRLHDLDMEAHMLFNQVARISNIRSEFRVYNGGHDWEVWRRGFDEGMRYLAGFIQAGDSASSESLGGTLLGSPDEDYAGGVAGTGDGGGIQALSLSPSAQIQPQFGDLDIAVIRWGTQGRAAWSRVLDTSASERAYGLALDTQQNVIVAGYTSGDLDGEHPDNDGNDAFVVKLSAEGEALWTLQFGDSAEADRAYALALGHDDLIYVAGYTKGSLDGENAGDKDVFIAQVSPEGEIVWLKQFGGSGEDKGLSLTVDGDTVFLAGVAGIGTVFTATQGDLDGFVTAFTSDGTQQWIEQLGSDGWDEANGIAAHDGKVYVTGFISGDFGTQSFQGERDIFITAMGSDGTTLWTEQMGTPFSDKGADIQIGDNGTIYVMGYTNGNFAGSAGEFDLVLFTYSAAGERAATRQLGTRGADGADEYAEENLFIDLDGNRLLVTGLTTGSIESTTNLGSYDVFLTAFGIEDIASD